MAINPEDWLAVEQVMEDENHVLLQVEVTDTHQQPPPQLLLISGHAAHGTSSAATFSLVVNIGGKRGVVLVNSGSTDSFMDYTFARQASCPILTTVTRTVKVAGGGSLSSDVVARPLSCTIQKEQFTDEFKLLQLKVYDMILGCDWIKKHSPIGLDLRDCSRQLII
jgi:hypothetical protein